MGLNFPTLDGGSGGAILFYFPSVVFPEDHTDKRKTRFRAPKKSLRKLPGNLLAQDSIDFKKDYH